MSIKFPDMQVLIGRTDQIPKILREGDPTGAGKVNPVIVQQYAERPKRLVTVQKQHVSAIKKKRNRNKLPRGAGAAIPLAAA